MVAQPDHLSHGGQRVRAWMCGPEIGRRLRIGLACECQRVTPIESIGRWPTRPLSVRRRLLADEV